MKHQELILMIFKTHQGECLTAAKVKAIVDAITGGNCSLATVNKVIERLSTALKLRRTETGYTLNV